LRRARGEDLVNLADRQSLLAKPVN